MPSTTKKEWKKRKPSHILTVPKLNFHAHEHPTATRDIQAAGPVVKRGQREASPLQALDQRTRGVVGHRPVHADDKLRARERALGELDQGHESADDDS